LQVPDLKKTILNQKNELCRTQDQLNLERAKSRLEINQTSAQKRNIEEENKLLLKQLHSVQEELEKAFIQSKNFKSLKKELDAVKVEAAEMETKLADGVVQLDACTKEREAHLAEHDIIQNELQKTLLECSRKNKEIQTLSAECKELKNRTLEFEKKQSELVIQGQKSATEREALQKDLAAAMQGTAETEKKRAELAAQLDARTKERDALNTEKHALDARLSALDSENKALVFEREALQKDLAAAMQGTAETEKGRADLAAQLEARTKERDTLGNERDQLKKTAGDRASRIAELEAQVADQAERQKLIDEQMVRAESQLEMLKQFLQPAFQ
jgi:chromosome segregation ATPase